jgi:hypothetical protein
MQTENPSGEPNSPSIKPSPTAKQRNERLDWIIEQLTLTAVAKGQTFSVERLQVNANDLIDIPQDSLRIAFNKARRELDYIPGVAELRRLAGVDEKGSVDAEARAAWEMLELFVRKYVDCDVYGNYGPEHGWYPRTYPLLSERIMGTVKRTGDWRVYKTMTDEQFPFQQRRFFDEYKAFASVRPILDSGRLLVMPQRKELPAPAAEPQAKPIEKPIPQVIIAKVPPIPTQQDLHNRAMMAKAAAAEWKKKREQRA